MKTKIYSIKNLSQVFQDSFYFNFFPKCRISYFTIPAWKVSAFSFAPDKELILKRSNDGKEIRIGFNLLNQNFLSEENYIEAAKFNQFSLLKKVNNVMYFHYSNFLEESRA